MSQILNALPTQKEEIEKCNYCILTINVKYIP